MGIFHFGSAGGLGVALLFEIVALSTPGWVYVTTNITMLNVTGLPPYSQYNIIRSAAYGLFYSEPAVDSEYGLYLGGTAISACVCFLCIAIGYLSIGIGINLASGSIFKGKILSKIGGIVGIIAGIFIMIGMACFTGLILDNPFYSKISNGPDCCLYAPFSRYCQTGEFPILDRVNVTVLQPTCSIEYSWGYSFALGWTVFCISVVSGVVAVVKG